MHILKNMRFFTVVRFLKLSGGIDFWTKWENEVKSKARLNVKSKVEKKRNVKTRLKIKSKVEKLKTNIVQNEVKNQIKGRNVETKTVKTRKRG